MRNIILLIGFLLISISSFSQEKPQLIVFSGSDWCNNCIKFKKTVLDQQNVKDTVNKYYDLIIADFPRDESILDKSTIEKNAQLADNYNASGVFPAVVIVKNGKELARKDGYGGELPETFLQWIARFNK